MEAYREEWCTPAYMGQIRVGEQIRARREYLNISLREAARRSGGSVGHSTLGQIENGDYNWTIGMLTSIAEILGMEVDVRIVPIGARLSDERLALLETLQRLIDKLRDRDVRALLAQLEAYERESEGAQGRSNR